MSETEHVCGLDGFAEGGEVCPACEAVAPRWPQVEAEDGALYSFADPRRPEERMIGMTLATWMKLKEDLDTMTDKLRSAQSANIELALKYQNAMEKRTQKQIILTPARGMKLPEES
jgi:hypothetical protein